MIDMVKRSRLSRNMKVRKANRLESVDNTMHNGGVVDVIKKGVIELRQAGEALPKAAKKATESEFAHEFLHLEKKPEPLSHLDAQHARELLEAGASMKDVADEFGYRPETMQQLIEEAEIEMGTIRGFF